MQFRRNKTMTPAERINAANERTGLALSLFDAVAVELDAAQTDLLQIEADLGDQANAKNDEAKEILREAAARAAALDDEAFALDEAAYVAFERSEQVGEQANTIRGLLGLAGPVTV